MRKRVLLLGGNFHPEPTGIGKYNGEMIDWFASQNIACTVVTTYPYYPQWRVQEPYAKKAFRFSKEIRFPSKTSLPVTIYRCPHYVPQNPSGFKRLVSDFTFLLSAYCVLIYLLFSARMDFIMTVAPSFSNGLLGVLYKKFRGAKFIYHIQDLQIDAARDLKIIRSGYFLKILFNIEKYILREADIVSTISEGMMQKVKAKCNKDIVHFPNWVDTRLFYPQSNKEAKASFGFKATDKIVLYSGAIGFKQELESIIHTAKFFQLIDDVKFVICGSGPYKYHLEQMAADLHLNNVVFLPLQPSEKFNTFLNMADVHLVLQKKDTADLVMPSKLTTILAVGGLSIVTASRGTSLHQVMHATDLGILIEPEDMCLLYNAIMEAINSDSAFLKTNARLYAETHLSSEIILNRFIENIFYPAMQPAHGQLTEGDLTTYILPLTTKTRLNTLNK